MKRIVIVAFLAYFGLNHLSAQCTEGNCINGKGTLMLKNGVKYIGEFKNGEINGKGILYYADGRKYEGNWLNRYPNGHGTMTFPGGIVLKSNWKNGIAVDEKGNPQKTANPQGLKTAEENMAPQFGCILGDCIKGRGIYAYPNGSKYDGNFLEGKANGSGEWHYTNGDRYVGTFKANYSDGKGVIYHADGTSTKGTWEKGVLIGIEQTENPGSGCIEGNCDNGSGTFIYKEDRTKYIGTFKDGFPEGQGTAWYANGEHYEGNWVKGSFHGLGTLTMTDGTKVSGQWSKGTYLPKEAKAEPKFVKQAANTTDYALKVPKTYALIIGVSEYSHMPVLKYSDNDAYKLYAYFKSPEGGSIPDKQIQALVDDDATHDNILEALEELADAADETDLIILYFSGHGLVGSFLPIDYDGINNKISHEDISRIVSGSKAKYKLVLADACHSGSLMTFKGDGAANSLATYYETFTKAHPGTALILSSKSEETSLEAKGLRQGVFSHFLINGLKGEADADNNKFINVRELFDYIQTNVRSYTGNRQSPVIQGDYDPEMIISSNKN